MIRYIIAGLIVFICSTASLSAQTNEYFLGVFSNESNTIKFTIGAYPHSISTSKRTDGTYYNTIKVAIINNEKADPIIWNDYKIYILLKDGSLFYNFLTSASTGDFSCKYTIAPGETHMQFFCFEKLFNDPEIDKVWLSLSDNQFLPLVRYVDKKATEADPATTAPVKK